jgi:hypothetical protein
VIVQSGIAFVTLHTDLRNNRNNRSLSPGNMKVNRVANVNADNCNQLWTFISGLGIWAIDLLYISAILPLF